MINHGFLAGFPPTHFSALAGPPLFAVVFRFLIDLAESLWCVCVARNEQRQQHCRFFAGELDQSPCARFVGALYELHTPLFSLGVLRTLTATL